MIIDCLNTTMKDEVRKLMEETMHILISWEKSISFNSVYDEISKDMEMDMESAAYIYRDVASTIKAKYDSKISKSLTSNDKLDEYIGGQIEQVIAQANSSENVINRSVTGQRENSAKNIAKTIIKVIDNKLFPTTTNKTAAKQVRDAVLTYARSILKSNAKPGMTPEAMLTEAIKTKLLDPASDTFGALNMDDLWDAIKPAMDTMASGISTPSIREQFKHEIQKIKEATLKLGITETKRKRILYDLIKKYKDSAGNNPWVKRLGLTALDREKKAREQLGEDPTVVRQWYEDAIKELKVEPDWNEITKQADPIAVLGKILDEELDSRGVTDRSLRDEIYQALIDDFNEVRSLDALTAHYLESQKANQKMLNDLSDEVAIDHGFFKREGARKVADYSANGDMDWLSRALAQTGVEPFLSRSKRPIPKSEVKNYIGDLVKHWVDKKTYDQVNAATKKLMAINNKKFREKAKLLDQLMRLEQKGYGLDAVTDGIAAKILGLRIKPEYIAELSEIAKMYNEMMMPAQQFYDEMEKDPNLNRIHPDWKEIREALPRWHTLGNYASISQDNINIRLSQLLAKAVRDDNWSDIPGLSQIFSALQRAYLTGMLMNVFNTAQNFFHAQFTMLSSVPKGDLKKLLADEALFFKTMYSIMSGDLVGMSDEEIRRSTDSNTIYHAKTPIGKVWGRAKALVEGVLTGIDAAAGVITTRHLVFNAMDAEARAKKYSPAEYRDKLKSYEWLKSTHVAMSIAKAKLRAAGIVEGYRPRQYARMLERETRNIELGFLMGSNMDILLSADRANNYYEVAKNVSSVRLGKKDVYWYDSQGRRLSAWNPFSALSRGIANEEKAATDAYNANKGPATASWLFGVSFISKWLNGGITSFAAGSWRFFLFAIAGLAGPVTWPVGYMKMSAAKKRLDELTKERGLPPGVNEDQVTKLRHNFEISRMYTKIGSYSVLGVAITLGILAATADDDDGDDYMGKILHQAYESAQNPFAKKFMSRVTPAWTRFITGFAEGTFKPSKIKTGATSPLGKAFGYAASTRTPMSPNDMVDMFYKNTGATVGRTLGSAFGGFGNMLWPVAYFNALYTEAYKGVKVPFYDTEHPLLEGTKYQETQFLNGFLIGMFGNNLTAAIDGDSVGAVEDLQLLGDTFESWKDMDMEQVRGDILGKKVTSIQWGRYGLKDIWERREEIQEAIDALPKIKNKIADLGKKWVAEGFDNSTDIKQFWDYPNLGFSIPAPMGVSNEILEDQYGVKPSDNGNINILAAAKNYLGYDDLTIQDFTNALKYQKLQEQLKKKN